MYTKKLILVTSLVLLFTLYTSIFIFVYSISNDLLSAGTVNNPVNENYLDAFAAQSNAITQFEAPGIKPEIEWTRVISNLDFDNRIAVDQQGQIWYSPSSENMEIGNSIICMDSSGIIINKIPACKYCQIRPILVYSNLVLFWSYNSLDNTVELLCFDSNGTLMWTSLPVKSDFFWPETWPISGDSIVIPAGKWDQIEFYVYSLHNGENLDIISFPEYEIDGWWRLGPVYSSDNSWITCTKNGITKYDNKLDVLWNYNEGNKSEKFCPLLLPNNVLVFGEDNKLTALDLETGNKIWEKVESGGHVPVGFTADCNILINETSQLSVLDFEGNYLKTIHTNLINSLSNSNIFVYNDNSVLCLNKHGLEYFDDNGESIWIINNYVLENYDLNLMYECHIYPAPAGRIILSYKLTSSLNETHIVSLRSK
jgi:outer membrane protein assembly factor BamB